MKKIVRILVREIIIIAVCVFMGTAALSLAYIGVSRANMSENVKASAIQLNHLGLGAHLWKDVEETMLELYTDGLLFNVSYTSVSDGIQDIFLDTYMSVGDTNPMNSLYEVTVLANDDYVINTYGRYWHGYQAILRPLLCFFTYSDILQLNMIVQFCLVVLFLYILAKSAYQYLIIPFCGMYLFLSPVSLFSSLQYSHCVYIMLLSLIALFIPPLQKYWNDTNRNYLFLLAGIATAYLDLLTYPCITLGIPLIACLGAAAISSPPLIRTLKNTVFYSASWAIGYAGMWISKWILASVLTDENIFLNAFEQVKFRSGYFSKKQPYRDTLRLNLSVCNKEVLLPVLICVILCAIVYKIKNHNHTDRNLLPSIAVLLFVSCYPFIWYALAKQHSSDNSYFTWRELGISVFGVLLIVALLVRKNDTGQEKPDDAS